MDFDEAIDIERLCGRWVLPKGAGNGVLPIPDLFRIGKMRDDLLDNISVRTAPVRLKLLRTMIGLPRDKHQALKHYRYSTEGRSHRPRTCAIAVRSAEG